MEESQENKFEVLGQRDMSTTWTSSAFQPANSLASTGASQLPVISASPVPIYSLFHQYLWTLSKEYLSKCSVPQADPMQAPTSTESSEAGTAPELQPLKVASVRVVYEAGKNKRGRKPLRPQDPVRRKTEEKDKYWLRAFRAFMQKRFPVEKKAMVSEDRFFWREYLSSEGKPDKGNKYLSYGQKYKDYLFSHASFVTHFQDWFHQFGQLTLEQKYKSCSDLWFVYYDYALKELVSYSSKPAV